MVVVCVCVCVNMCMHVAEFVCVFVHGSETLDFTAACWSVQYVVLALML